jgi:hypothetical protein
VGRWVLTSSLSRISTGANSHLCDTIFWGDEGRSRGRGRGRVYSSRGDGRGHLRELDGGPRGQPRGQPVPRRAWRRRPSRVSWLRKALGELAWGWGWGWLRVAWAKVFRLVLLRVIRPRASEMLWTLEREKKERKAADGGRARYWTYNPTTWQPAERTRLTGKCFKIPSPWTKRKNPKCPCRFFLVDQRDAVVLGGEQHRSGLIDFGHGLSVRCGGLLIRGRDRDGYTWVPCHAMPCHTATW